MKKLFVASLLVSLLLTSCGGSKDIKTVGNNLPVIESQSGQNDVQPTWSEKIEVNNQSDFFINKELGIKFAYSSDEYKGKLVVDGNKIKFQRPDSSEPEFIQVFAKQKSETIEEALLALVNGKGKDSSKCKVIDNGAAYGLNSNYKEYVIDLANPNITYSQEELTQIKLADKAGKDEERQQSDPTWKSPSKEFAEIEIHIKRLIDTCSDYANPLGNGTSKTIPSKFIYDNKDVFLFLPGLTSPSFYKDDSIELLK